jgi:hypothetical protein
MEMMDSIPCPTCMEGLSKESLTNLDWLECFQCGNKFKISRGMSLNSGDIMLIGDDEYPKEEDHSFYQ